MNHLYYIYYSCQNDNEDTPEAPPNTRAPSPQGIPVAEGRLPHAESIPQENQAVAEPWIEVILSFMLQTKFLVEFLCLLNFKMSFVNQ